MSSSCSGYYLLVKVELSAARAQPLFLLVQVAARAPA